MDDTRTAAAQAASAAPALLERVSWGSIVAGALIALAILTVLNLIGLAFGLYALDAEESDLGAGTAAWTMGIWWALSSLVALYVGGWVAGRLAGIPSGLIAGIHGAAVWALATLLGVWAISSATTAAFSGAAGLVREAAQGAGQVAPAAASALDPAIDVAADAFAEQLRQEGLPANQQEVRTAARDVFNQAISPAERQQLEQLAQRAAADAVTNPQAAQQELRQFMQQAFGANGVINEQDRAQAVSAMSQRLGVPEAQLRTTLDRWQQQFTDGQSLDQMMEQVQTRAAETTERSAGAVGSAALWTAIGLILALAAAAFGGMTGGPSAAATPFARGRGGPRL